MQTYLTIGRKSMLSYLNSECSQHIIGERLMFQRTEEE